MQTTDAPASAAEQLSFAPDSTVPSPTRHLTVPCDHEPSPVDSRAGDGELPTVSPARAVGSPAGAADNTAVSNDNARRLAQLVAQGRQPRSRRFTALEPYREVLLAERRTGASIRLIAQSLAKLEVAISEETLRVWFLREKLPKRRRPRKKRVATPTANFGAIVPAVAVRPVIGSVPAPVPGAAATQPGRRGPRIARDIY